VPLFKSIWISGVLLSGGSYFALLALIWLTHALNVLLFTILLRRCGFSTAAAALAALAAGLPATNIETLGWSVQLSPLLSFTFFLLGALALFRLAQRAHWLHAAAIPILALCSGLCFSRGVLSGLCFAAVMLLCLGLRIETRGPRLITVIGCLAASAVIAFAIARTASGNHQHLFQAPPGIFADIARFGAAFLLLNPLHDLLRLRASLTTQMALLGTVQAVTFAWALWTTSGRKRAVIALFALFDLMNGVLVAIGRYHTGMGAVVSSRYQYVPLFCLAPSFAALLESGTERLRQWASGPSLAAIGLAVAALVGWPWRMAVREWSWRGEARDALARGTDATMPHTAGLAMAEARALQIAYHLH
jgi:hypothetical protein